MDCTTLVDAFSKKAVDEKERVEKALDETNVQKLVEDIYRKFEDLLETPGDAWKIQFPGKCILLPFCGEGWSKG